MKNLKSNIYFKSLTIGILILALLIPAAMVKNLIEEREQLQSSTIDEVSSKWGKGQTIIGPYISIPYDDFITRSRKEGNKTIKEKVKVRKYAHFLPEELNINGNITPEQRHRGIYEVVVYDSKLTLQGSFLPPSFEQLNIYPSKIYWDKATLNIGISDLKGIENQIELNWNGNKSIFNPGTSNSDIAINGINTSVALNDSTIQKIVFNTNLLLKGSQYLYFTPVGKTTKVHMASHWQNPSFTGIFLPDNNSVNDEGFHAEWNVLNLNRNFPQSWNGNKYNIAESSFGTQLLLPVDNYAKSYRVAKYAILFLVLTFLTFFFVEVMKKVAIHPIQYLLVGLALIIFYLLLLSFSEHILFNTAYIISALLTLAIISLYTGAITKSKAVAGLIFGILSIVYTFIFVIIQLQGYALLVGSIGVFMFLALIMYFSRRIDWYNIKFGNDSPLITPQMETE